MKEYTAHDLKTAVLLAMDPNNNGSIRFIAKKSNIPPSTLGDAINRHNSSVAAAARGRKQVLGPQHEEDLKEWILAMQKTKQPVTSTDIIDQACRIAHSLCPGQNVGRGWFEGFIKRHPDLSKRKAQNISNARNQVTDEDVVNFFKKIKEAVELVESNPARIFNMDETGFAPKRHANNVIAERGSSNVWAQDATANFHMTIAGCIGAGGQVLPPLFILPGVTVSFDTFNELTIADAAISTTSSGFMNARLFKLWLQMFSRSIGDEVDRPVLLVYDGCASHLSLDILEEAEKLQVLLFKLPANTTHLFQPLDVGVFGPLKRQIRTEIRLFSRQHAGSSISKLQAVQMACASWVPTMRRDICIHAFVATGIYPPCEEKMLARFGKYANGGKKSERIQAAWLKCVDEAQTRARENDLVLPPKSKKVKKTMNIVGIVTRAEAEAARKKPKSKAVSRESRAMQR
jgi:hypothetical protein